MKIKNLFLMMMFCASSMIVITSCDKENDIIESWKIYLVEKYGRKINPYPKTDSFLDKYMSYSESYLQKRFESLFPNPNEDQEYSYSLAKKGLTGINIFYFEDDNFMLDVFTKYFEQGKGGQLAKSNPELFAKRVCKIIGPVNEFKKELASHAKVEKVYSEKDTNFNRYLVLYSIEFELERRVELYVICLITEKSDGQNEMQELKKSESINEILNEWANLVED